MIQLKEESNKVIEELISVLKGAIYSGITTFILITVLNMTSCSLLDNLKDGNPLTLESGSASDAGISTEVMCLDIINNITREPKLDVSSNSLIDEDIESDINEYIATLESAHTFCTKERERVEEEYVEILNNKDAEINKLVEERDFYKDKFEEIQSVFSNIGGETETTEDTQ